MNDEIKNIIIESQAKMENSINEYLKTKRKQDKISLILALSALSIYILSLLIFWLLSSYVMGRL